MDVIDEMSNICRACLEISPKLYPLEGPIANVDVFIATMLAYCTSTEIIIDDNLPKGICIACFKIVRISYNFIKEFRNTNRKLLAERELNKNLVQLKEEIPEHIEICTVPLEGPSGHSCISPDEKIVTEDKHSSESQSEHSYSSLQEENIGKDEYSSEKESEHAYSSRYKETITNDELSSGNESDLLYNSSHKENITKEEHSSNESDEIESDEEINENMGGTSKTINNLGAILSSQSFDKFKCPICSMDTFTEFNKGLVKHLRRCHKNALFKCDKCSLDVELSVDTYITHYSLNHLYRCPTCYHKLRTRSGFINHMKNHRVNKFFQCTHPNCGKTFQSKLRLNKHLPVHSNIPKYVCSKCGKKFVTYDTFRYHNKTHDGTRSFLCNVCGRSFLQSVHLKYHMWQHTGIKKFCCTDCGRTYTSTTQLKKHRRKYCGSEEINEKF